MPGPITHLKAAYKYNEARGGSYNKPLLYLGSICPDSVNINGHAPKSIRWPAHLRDTNLECWLNNAKTFYRDNYNVYDYSYLTGYILHIITDIVWDKSFDRPLFEAMYRSGIPADNLKNMRWQELYGYEQLQIRLPWFEKDIIPMLSTASISPIGSLKSGEIEIFRNMVLNLELERGCTPRFINDDIMNSFFDAVTKCANRIFI